MGMSSLQFYCPLGMNDVPRIVVIIMAMAACERKRLNSICWSFQSLFFPAAYNLIDLARIYVFLIYKFIDSGAGGRTEASICGQTRTGGLVV